MREWTSIGTKFKIFNYIALHNYIEYTVLHTKHVTFPTFPYKYNTILYELHTKRIEYITLTAIICLNTKFYQNHFYCQSCFASLWQNFIFEFIKFKIWAHTGHVYWPIDVFRQYPCRLHAKLTVTAQPVIANPALCVFRQFLFFNR